MDKARCSARPGFSAYFASAIPEVVKTTWKVGKGIVENLAESDEITEKRQTREKHCNQGIERHSTLS
jgi:hypothetical protein